MQSELGQELKNRGRSNETYYFDLFLDRDHIFSVNNVLELEYLRINSTEVKYKISRLQWKSQHLGVILRDAQTKLWHTMRTIPKKNSDFVNKLMMEDIQSFQRSLDHYKMIWPWLDSYLRRAYEFHLTLETKKNILRRMDTLIDWNYKMEERWTELATGVAEDRRTRRSRVHQ